MYFTIDGPELRRLRKEQGMTIAYLARVVRMTSNSVMHWESGHYRTSERVIEAIAHALGVAPYAISPDYVPPRDPLLGRVYFDQALALRVKAERGMSYRELADRSEIPLKTLHYILVKDKPSADAEHVYSIAVALGLQPGDLSQPLAAAPTPGERAYRENAGVPYTY